MKAGWIQENTPDDIDSYYSISNPKETNMAWPVQL